jgi:ketosteroid isomerase-like protein
MKTRILVAALGLLLAGGANAACSDADKAALEKFDRDWSEAGATGNRAALEAIYAESYSDLVPGGSSGRDVAINDTIEAAEKQKASGKPAPVRHQDFYEIGCTGNSALITHRVWGMDGEGADATQWQVRSVHHLEKIGGRWQVVSNATHGLTDDWVVGYTDLEWNQAELKGDKAWFERTLTDDYWGVSSRDGALENKAALLAEVGKRKVSVAITTDMDVQVDGDRALVTGIYHTEGTDAEGKPYKSKTRYIDGFVKRDGRWKIWSSQGTEIKD